MQAGWRFSFRKSRGLSLELLLREERLQKKKSSRFWREPFLQIEEDYLRGRAKATPSARPPSGWSFSVSIAFWACS